jgi:signal transduction histidine kinase
VTKLTRIVGLGRRYWLDALVFVGLALGIVAVFNDRHKATGPQGPTWFDILVVAGFTLPLLARRQFPVGALVAVGVVVGASSFVDGSLLAGNFVSYLSGLTVAALFGMNPSRVRSIGGIVLVFIIAGVVQINDPNGKAGDFAWSAITFSVAWIVGFAIGGKFREADVAKELAARAEGEREEQARIAVEEERARIARELHDVVGHSVSVMTVQASAVRRLLEPDQEKEREALLVVEQTGREALAEMRRMVGVLRRAEEMAQAPTPEPSLEHA